MSIIIRNSELNDETISALNTLIDMDIDAGTAFKLTRIIKEISSIVEDKVKLEKKVLEKFMVKGEDGNALPVKDEDGNLVEGAVNISDTISFNSEMESLMNFENSIGYDKIKFDDLSLKTAKVKDLIKLDFLFD
jgi:hypothetical protein